MSGKRMANFEELARRILVIVDDWQQLQRVSPQPDGTLPEIAALLTLCFGPDGAEAITRELISEIEIFDSADEDETMPPNAESRTAFLAQLLRNEFSD